MPPQSVMSDASPALVKFDWLTELSPLGLVCVFVAFLCYFARRLKHIPTSWVWPFTAIGVLLYIVIAPANVSRTHLVNTAYSFMYGCVASIVGTLFAWALHDKGFVWLASKWPMWSFLVSDDIKPNNPNTP